MLSFIISSSSDLNSFSGNSITIILLSYLPIPTIAMFIFIVMKSSSKKKCEIVYEGEVDDVQSIDSINLDDKRENFATKMKYDLEYRMVLRNAMKELA